MERWRRAWSTLPADLDPGLLDAPRRRVRPVDFERLHRAVVRARDDELYGYLPRPVPRGTYETLVRVATRLPDLRAVFDAAQDVYGLFAQRPVWRLRVGRAGARLEVLAATRAQQGSLLFTHALMLSLWRTCAWLSQDSLPALEVTLPPRFEAYVSETRFLTGTTPRILRGPGSLVLAAGALDLPVRRERAAVGPWARRESFAALLSRPPGHSIESRVRAELARHRHGRASQPEIAAALGLSRATLGRHLRDAGLTFRQIRDDLHRDQAVGLLAAGRTVAQVSDALGFSEPSAFQRAFKAWTGATPGEVRRARGR